MFAIFYYNQTITILPSFLYLFYPPPPLKIAQKGALHPDTGLLITVTSAFCDYFEVADIAYGTFWG